MKKVFCWTTLVLQNLISYFEIGNNLDLEGTIISKGVFSPFSLDSIEQY